MPIPASHRDLLDGPVYATLSTLMPDGSIQSTLVWCDFDGRFIRVNTKVGRVKELNTRRDPRVTLLLVDTTNPWKYLTIRGRVVEKTTNAAFEHLDRLTKKYLGQEKYYGFVEPEDAKEGIVRCILKIEPEQVMANGG
ncbi:MAG: PPOX class F420-dependent oxidoreductase [Gammaproteobacteria bacterium]|nr:MAG: PPOX class F420-dependent oxidoreductase [Gammaproteobacteria bacterium]